MNHNNSHHRTDIVHVNMFDIILWAIGVDYNIHKDFHGQIDDTNNNTRKVVVVTNIMDIQVRIHGNVIQIKIVKIKVLYYNFQVSNGINQIVIRVIHAANTSRIISL